MLYPAELWVQAEKTLFSLSFGYSGGMVLSRQSGTKGKCAAQCGTVVAHFVAQAGLGIALCCAPLPLASAAPAQQFAESAKCSSAKAVDGDTLRCGNLGLVRLLSIDAPEMPGHCRKGRVCTAGDGKAARRQLAALIKGHSVHCTATARDHYNRLLARCTAAGRDLSCAMVDSGHAVVRYGKLKCRKG